MEFTHGWFYTRVRIQTADSTAVLYLSRTKARIFKFVIELSRRLVEIRTVHEKLVALENPDRYVNDYALSILEKEALTSIDGLGEQQPNQLSDVPEVRMLQGVQEFLKDPSFAQDKSNKTFVINELIRSQRFFDEIEARPLTFGQRLSIVINDYRNLVVAAAGSGKTSVIVAKTSWLIHKKYCTPSDVLLLSFQRSARREMEERLDKHLGSATAREIMVHTFHSLGLDIIGKFEGVRPSLDKTAEDPQKLLDLLQQIIDELLVEDDLFVKLKNWFLAWFVPYKSPHEFQNWGQYYDYLRNYDIRTLRDERVRSIEECMIANFLFLNGVNYEYEADYKHKLATEEYRQYKPDFYLTEHNIYIEHFGINHEGNPPSFIDRERYRDNMEWKRNTHTKYGTVLVETYSWEQTEGKLLGNLKKKLQDRGVALKPLPRQDTFAAFKKRGQIYQFTHLVRNFLQHYKGRGLSIDKCRLLANEGADNHRMLAFLAMFEPILERYEDKLKHRGTIDFHDMIQHATKLVEEESYRCPYTYILVDEFQDISPARATLLTALLNSSQGTQLFAVGDDWQAIYRFAGSDIAVMRNFSEYFGSLERLDLATTFRCDERITKVASEFVLRNTAQIYKKIHATRKAGGPAIFIGLPNDQEYSLLEEALDRIKQNASQYLAKSQVLLLGRYRHLQPDGLDLLQNQYSDLNFTWKTVHGSKGSEADYVVVFSLCSGKYGFPSEIADDPLFDLVLSTPENYPNAEERRLLYVALTRARRQVYLLTDGGKPSKFVTELIEEGYDVEKFGCTHENDRPCPRCEKGNLVLRKNTRDQTNFFGCSNYPYCEHTERDEATTKRSLSC